MQYVKGVHGPGPCEGTHGGFGGAIHTTRRQPFTADDGRTEDDRGPIRQQWQRLLHCEQEAFHILFALAAWAISWVFERPIATRSALTSTPIVVQVTSMCFYTLVQVQKTYCAMIGGGAQEPTMRSALYSHAPLHNNSLGYALGSTVSKDMGLSATR